MHPRHRIDASALDAIVAIAESVVPDSLRRPRSATTRGLICLSVRSSFELLLEALQLTRGDEVLMSAITHPDMVRIIHHHGLRAIPVDIDPRTLSPCPASLEAAITDRSRAVLVAHLFGARVALDGVADFAGRNGLLLLEDCAQSIRGGDDEGDERADVSMFSFGLIKTATAFGGAVVRVRDADLAAAMRGLHARWACQSRSAFAGRAARALAVIALNRPKVYGATVGRNLDAVAARLGRTIPAGSEEAFRAWLRRRPSAPLVATIERRLRRFPAARLRGRAAAGDDLAARLPSNLSRPGDGVPSSHWLFPVVSDDPESLVRCLRHHGFDATRGATQIRVVPAPPDRPDLQPRCAERLMKGMVFLPAYPELPMAERRRLARVLAHAPAHRPP